MNIKRLFFKFFEEFPKILITTILKIALKFLCIPNASLNHQEISIKNILLNHRKISKNSYCKFFKKSIRNFLLLTKKSTMKFPFTSTVN